MRFSLPLINFGNEVTFFSSSHSPASSLSLSFSYTQCMHNFQCEWIIAGSEWFVHVCLLFNLSTITIYWKFYSSLLSICLPMRMCYKLLSLLLLNFSKLMVHLIQFDVSQIKYKVSVKLMYDIIIFYASKNVKWINKMQSYAMCIRDAISFDSFVIFGNYSTICVARCFALEFIFPSLSLDLYECYDIWEKMCSNKSG